MAHLSLKNHRKTRRLMVSLDVSRPTAMGHLECLWHDVQEDKNVGPDGALVGWTPQDVASAGDWADDPKQFCDSLVAAEFLDYENGAFMVHHYGDWAPEFVRKRWKRSGVDHGPHPRITDLSGQRPDSGRQRPPLSSTKRNEAQRSATKQTAAQSPPATLAAPKTRKPRKRDPIWDRVCELWYSSGLSAAGKKEVGAIVSDFKAHTDCTAEEIDARFARYRREWPDAAQTARALQKNWDYFERAKYENRREKPANSPGHSGQRSSSAAAVRRAEKAAREYPEGHKPLPVRTGGSGKGT